MILRLCQKKITCNPLHKLIFFMILYFLFLFWKPRMPHWIFLKLRAYKPTCSHCVNYPSATFPHQYQHMEWPNQRQNFILLSHWLTEQTECHKIILFNFSGMLQNSILLEKWDFSIQNQIYRKTITAPLRKIAHIASECFTHCILLLEFCTHFLGRSSQDLCDHTEDAVIFCSTHCNSDFLFKVDQKLFLPPRSFFQKKKKDEIAALRMW